VLVDRCNPTEVIGIDPSEEQLAFARNRPAVRLAEFRQGDLMALPFPDERFDSAVMALVIFFARDPAKGVSEMRRVVRPGGTVASYIWDMLGGGSPSEPVHVEMRAMGVTLPSPPSLAASRMDVLQALWNGAGLEATDTREITVERTFADFAEFWTTTLLNPSVGPAVALMPPDDVETLKVRVRARLPSDGTGKITCIARANAIKGSRPF
jgi:ubiquinone/menaquinone biosynthesis C-methylase UbiE